MPTAPAIVGNLVESAIGRHGRAVNITQPAPGFLDLDLDIAPPPGGWRPGHEIQFRVAPTLGRRYTVRWVDERNPARIRILAAIHASGPGTAWIRRLRAGTDVTLLAAPHIRLRQSGVRRLYLGDGSSIGTIDAYVNTDRQHVVVVEVPTEAIAALKDRWPFYHFVPVMRMPGDALQIWLENAASRGELAGLNGAVLLGHAQSIQRQRQALKENQVLPRRAVTTKPYWANGKQGL